MIIGPGRNLSPVAAEAWQSGRLACVGLAAGRRSRPANERLSSMKLLDSPRTGRLGSHIFYPSPFGQCCRALTVPHDPKTPAQSRARAIFGSCSNAWGRTLTEAQRQRWVSAAQTAPSHPSLGQYYHLSGQQFCVQINSTLRWRVGYGGAKGNRRQQGDAGRQRAAGWMRLGFHKGGSVLIEGAGSELRSKRQAGPGRARSGPGGELRVEGRSLGGAAAEDKTSGARPSGRGQEKQTSRPATNGMATSEPLPNGSGTVQFTLPIWWLMATAANRLCGWRPDHPRDLRRRRVLAGSFGPLLTIHLIAEAPRYCHELFCLSMNSIVSLPCPRFVLFRAGPLIS